MAEIVLGRIAGPAGTAKMMELMKREPFAGTTDNDDQAHGFTGKMIIDRKMTDAMLWSKAGWTSKSRHDAAYIETVDGQKFVLVIFTENHANEKGLLLEAFSVSGACGSSGGAVDVGAARPA